MTNSFPSEVKIKERERGKEREAVLSQVHKPKHTSRSARPAINPSLGEGSSQLPRFLAVDGDQTAMAIVLISQVVGG